MIIEKKAMSEVVTTIIMVVLVLALIAVVWGVINNMVNKELKNTEACFGNFNKVSINEAYTCYNLSSGGFDFSVSVGDTNVDKIIIMLGSQGTTSSITLNSTSQNITGVKNYPSNTTGVSAPGANSGKTYIYYGFSSAPEYIRVSPVIGGETCQESDSLTNIEDCSS